MEKIFNEVRSECERQDRKWGIQDHNAVEWVAILTEEVGEVAKEAVDFHFANGDVDPKMKAGPNLQRHRIENYRKEMIQVAAVAIQAIASMDRVTGRD